MRPSNGTPGAGLRHSTAPLRPLIAMAVALVLSGCVAAGVGGGLVAIGAVAQERRVADAVSDTQIRVEINEAWLTYSEPMLLRLNLMVQEGRVLVVGRVPTIEEKVEAVRRAAAVRGVTEVIDEITVGPPLDLEQSLADERIASRYNLALFTDGGVNPLDVSFEVLGGEVFLIGVVSSIAARDAAIAAARSLPEVRRVVSYLRIQSPPPGQ